MSTIVAATGSVVAMVRMLVRDLIGELISILLVRLPLWTAETVGTLGFAAPYVVAQITALVAKWGAKISRLLKALVTSLRNLMPVVRRLDEIIETIATLLRRRHALPGTVGSPRTIHRGPNDLFSTGSPRTNRDVLDNGAGTPPTAENVRSLAQTIGIDLDDVDVFLIDGAEEIRYLDVMDACAYTPSDLPGQIRFGPASFVDRETLAATIAHEYRHVLQQRAGEHLARPLSELEDEAYAAEDVALALLRRLGTL